MTSSLTYIRTWLSLFVTKTEWICPSLYVDVDTNVRGLPAADDILNCNFPSIKDTE